MLKKLIALFLAMVFCFALLVGCGGNGNETTSATNDATAGTEATTEATEPVYTTPDLSGVKITLYANPYSDGDYEGSYANTIVEEKLGVNVEVIELDEFATNIKNMLAEKKPPELMFVTNYTHANWAEFGVDGAYINFMDYIDQMPNVKAYLADPANAAQVEKFMYSDTELYALPVSGAGDSTACAFLYRKDVFEKNNIEVPTNQEEFVAVLRKLKEIYPDSMPFVMRKMTGNIEGAMNLGFLFGASHVNRGKYGTFMVLNEDGEYYMAQTSNAYKEMAQFIADMTAEGLMHASSMTIDNATWIETLASGTSFITYDKIDRIPQLTQAGAALDPECQLAAFAPFNFGTYATETDTVSTSYTAAATSFAFMVGETAIVDDVITYVDWLYSEEGILMTNWGIEGESYEVLADGTRTFKEGFLESKGGFAASCLRTGGMCAYQMFDNFLDTCDEEMAKGLEMAQEFTGKTTRQYALIYNEEEQLVWDTYAEALYSAAQSEWSKYVLGQKSFDEWDTFQKYLEDNYYYNEVKAIHESALERLLSE